MYQTEKFIKDNEDKVPADVKEKVESSITNAQEKLKGSDVAAIKEAIEKLSTDSQALGQAIYDAQAKDSVATGGGNDSPGGDEEVFDAEVVDEPGREDNR